MHEQPFFPAWRWVLWNLIRPPPDEDDEDKEEVFYIRNAYRPALRSWTQIVVSCMSSLIDVLPELRHVSLEGILLQRSCSIPQSSIHPPQLHHFIALLGTSCTNLEQILPELSDTSFWFCSSNRRCLKGEQLQFCWVMRRWWGGWNGARLLHQVHTRYHEILVLPRATRLEVSSVYCKLII